MMVVWGKLRVLGLGPNRLYTPSIWLYTVGFVEASMGFHWLETEIAKRTFMCRLVFVECHTRVESIVFFLWFWHKIARRILYDGGGGGGPTWKQAQSGPPQHTKKKQEQNHYQTNIAKKL